MDIPRAILPKTKKWQGFFAISKTGANEELVVIYLHHGG